MQVKRNPLARLNELDNGFSQRMAYRKLIEDVGVLPGEIRNDEFVLNDEVSSRGV